MNIERQRQILFEKDETLGYIEREQAIDDYLRGDVPDDRAERYVDALEYVLSRLSTPIEEEDLLLGHMVEGPIPFELEPVPGNGFSHVGNPFRPTGREAGHMSLDYADLMRRGLGGIADAMERDAITGAQKRYAALARRAAEAVRAFATRYADAAEDSGMPRAARALRKVPYEPAYDLFSAMQGVWLIEWILSCVTGGRDFAYSRLDLSLLPYYRPDEREDALEILKSFFLKNNEIGGLNSDLHERKPVPCTATNIYLMLGGKGAEEALELSLLFLEAAQAVSMPQPSLALRIAGNSPHAWKLACANAAQTLHGQASFYNDDVLIPSLTGLGYPDDLALHYTMSGCNRADFIGHQSGDHFHNCPAALLEAFYDEDNHTMEDILAGFEASMRREVETYPGNIRVDPDEELRFNLESLLLRGCAQRVCDVENGGQCMETAVHQLCGIATVADSLCAIHKTVFQDQAMSLDAFRELVKGEFSGDPLLHRRIRGSYPKYGNDDPEADRWVSLAGEIMARTTREATRPGGPLHIPGLYSLFSQHRFGDETGATPDGRLRGEPISENQSPTYGADVEGLTALLLSASRLPHNLIGCGGLNVRLDSRLDDGMIVALADAYFGMGGSNLCINVVSRETLLAAYEHPELYPTLCVRIVGFSEIFVRLPEYMKRELIHRASKAV